MARDIWLISDTHFQHENIIRYCSRPFSNAEEMDEVMIERWNSVVKPGDKVYHLGDVYMGDGSKMSSLFPRLKGKKRLILGNHDDLKRPMGSIRLGDVFEKIYLFRAFTEFGLMLTHVPVHKESIIRAGEGSVNVHGHIHEKPSPEGPYKCVCVEQTNYTPVNIEELRVK